MRLSEDDFTNLVKSRKAAPETPKGIGGRGRTTKRVLGQMNGTEAAYAHHLDARQASREILRYWFEALTFRLADGCRYTPDFVVQMPDGMIEIHEVKGHWEDDALVKIKVAADLFPFRFIAVQKIAQKAGGGWAVREF
jgi:hypothetical protein